MIFPPLSGTLDPWQFSSDIWKLFSSVFTWLLLLLHKNTKKKKQPCSLSLTSPCLSIFALNNAWNVVWQALPLNVCLCIMYCLLQRFSNFLHQVPPQKIFGFPSTTIMTNIKMQYKWLPTAQGVCSRCVCVCVCVCSRCVCVCVCVFTVCVCALWMG